MVITHRNILANIVPIEREIVKYRRYARPIPADPVPEPAAPQPHVRAGDGDLRAADAGRRGGLHAELQPAGDRRARSRQRRVSVLVSVPKMLDVLRDHVVAALPATPPTPDPATMHWHETVVALSRRASRVRMEVLERRGRRGAARSRARGVLGAAWLPGDSRLRAHRDGADRHAESPVLGAQGIGRQADSRRRGEDCGGRRDPRARRQRHAPATTAQPDATAEAFEDGWLHTGDIGGLDEPGRVFIRGRKKEMIVTPEGLNVFPEDVERELIAHRPACASRRWSAGAGRARSASTRCWCSSPATDVERGRARRERAARRSPEDPQRIDLAVGADCRGRKARAS